MRIVLGLALAAAALVALPHVVSNIFYVNIASQILIYALFALSVNILVGYGGMTTLGHAAYFGVAAYAAALLTGRWGWDPLLAAVGALAITTALAAFFGVLALRAAGIGFLMITLALGQIVWGVAYRWVDLTGGDNGVALTRRPMPFGIDLSGGVEFYYFTLAVCAVATFLIWRLVHSPYGATLRGTRDQPRRMRMLGHDVWRIRWLAFVASGFWAGVSGLLFLYYNKFVSPFAVALQSSAEGLLMAILGGASSFTGPIVGAVIVTLVKNVASSYVERWNALLGLIFVVTVVFMPLGIVPGLKALWARLRRPKAPVRPAEPPAAAAEPALVERAS